MLTVTPDVVDTLAATVLVVSIIAIVTALAALLIDWIRELF